MIITLILCSLIPVLLIEIIFLLGNRRESVTPWVTLCFSILLYGKLIIRSIKISFPALTNIYESLLFFSATILLISSIMLLKKWVSEVIGFGGTLAASVLLLICSSPLIPGDIKPPIPALQSNWLLVHVGFAFIGQSFFLVSFIAAIAGLRSRTRVPEYERIALSAIQIGYPIYTAGAIIFGAIWGSKAWGRFWGWDPKETWALITVIIYTIFLHGKFQGRRGLWIVVIAFLSSLFTFLGVNFLLPGLHSYR